MLSPLMPLEMSWTTPARVTKILGKDAFKKFPELLV